MGRLLVTIACAGCSFQDGVLPGGDAGGDTVVAIDSPPGAVDIDHLPPGEEYGGTGGWTVSSAVQINTTTLSVSTSLPAGVTLLAGMQASGGAIAILRVEDLTIANSVTLTAVGDKPLAILSSHDVDIQGTIDVGAHGAVSGPGGAGAGQGTGAGGVGLHDDGTGTTYDDSGGGGGSFGSVGAAGGTAGPFAGGAAGTAYAADSLVGGSGGGRPPNFGSTGCTNAAGAGGGALLLYAANKLTVSGAITAGGGGGAGGVVCGGFGYGPGAGAGSGGLIWLQSPELAGSGVLAANGGGGGGASYSGQGNGGPGDDGLASATSAAQGGTKANSTEATAGSDGAVQGTPAPMVPTLSGGNGGGGGGGLGRIIFRAPSLGSLQSSPTAAPAP